MVIIPGVSNCSVTFIKQNIRQFSGNYIVTDLNGNVYPMLEHELIDNGYTVKVLDLLNLEESVCYDPFANIETEEDVLTRYDRDF